MTLTYLEIIISKSDALDSLYIDFCDIVNKDVDFNENESDLELWSEVSNIFKNDPFLDKILEHPLWLERLRK